jgi:undecaprenyl-diphosphatase
MDTILLFKAFILGLVEGATEFLPVSSTGHLIILGDLINFNDDSSKVFEIFIQLGAILAICWEYREKLALVAKGALNDQSSQRFIINIAGGFLPAAVLGLIFHSKIKEFLFSPITVATALIVGGLVILYVENRQLKPIVENADDMTFTQAIKVGFAQSLALIPGTSRSGATILGGMIFGLSRKVATEFSFFVAVPIMFAATFYDLYKSRDLLSSDDIGVFAIGFITAFLAALVAIKVLLKYVATHDFKLFAYYRIALGIIVLLYFLT